MSHVVSRQPWGVVDLDTGQGRIFFQQDWLYHWHVLGQGTQPWTYKEKKDFHHAVDRQIWSRWSMRIRVRVSGNSAFARKFAALRVPINFDVRWVLHVGQWSIQAYKVPPGSSVNVFRSNVIFASRIINLYTAALAPYSAGNAAGASNPGFLAYPHEFGHSIGAPDEYNLGNPYIGDSASIMNIGKQVRERHLTLMLQTLNTMIPETVFTY